MPEWGWKFASLFASICVLPLAGWIWSTQQTVSTQDIEITHLQERIEEKTSMLIAENREQQEFIIAIEKDMNSFDTMQTDIAVIKNQIEHVSESLDEIKKSLRQ